MLDILKRFGCKATLMVTSFYADGIPEMTSLLERAVHDGHELANHMPHDRPYH